MRINYDTRNGTLTTKDKIAEILILGEQKPLLA